MGNLFACINANLGRGLQFLVRGVVYQKSSRVERSRRDPLADDGIEDFRIDLETFKELGINTLFVYQVDQTNNHDAVMELLEDAGIYVLVCLCTPKVACIDRTAPYDSYNERLLEHCFSTIDCLAAYPNTLGVLVANELINGAPSTTVAPIIRAVTRDVKRYMALAQDASGQRILPVGYSAADVRMYTRPTFDFLTAGSVDDSVDFFCIDDFSDTHIPIFFSEYGSNVVRPRLFHETTAIYSPEMTHVLSGGCVYEFYRHPNNYGIVETSQLPDGTKKMVKTAEFKTLKKRLQGCMEQPGTDDAPVKDQAVVTARVFPALSSTWRASSEVPPSPVDWKAVHSQLDLRSWVVLESNMQRGGTVQRSADDFNLRLQVGFDVDLQVGKRR
ncbi:DNA photolyase phr1 [Diaporthe australafricana]|uniref:1,3-beta-glucanosyltransferase n=1 Tax=Diaporthe australafricana TaxID=127596 RepID=A0ABR3XIE0_9PEZI